MSTTDSENRELPFIQDPHATASIEEEEEEEEPKYTVDHLSAVVRPVALTMILASLAVAYVREPSQDQALSSGLSMYLVYNEGSSSSTPSSGEMIGQALINAIVIVCVICAATFIIVLCYYFRCIKLMIAYLIFASMSLLGYTGAFMVMTAVQVWKLIFDYPSLGFIMFNFAVGGVIAIFWQKGVPRYITQAYLVVVSVIMAWILTKLPEWTSWALLVMLALYDLCAVLTPCGPLRALIALAQTRQDPIPGLLYEADVGNSANNPDRVRDTFVTQPRQPGQNGGEASPPQQVVAVVSPSQKRPPGGGSASPPSNAAAVPPSSHPVSTVRVNVKSPNAGNMSTPANTNTMATTASPQTTVVRSPLNASQQVSSRSQPPPSQRQLQTPQALQRNEAITAVRQITPTDKRASAAADGADVDTADFQGPPRPTSAHSSDNLGHVGPTHVDQPYVHGAVEDAVLEPEERSIKLGLGDFVFYSVLVSRAALFDVSTMVACFVAVIMGLGGTLLLLGVFKKALPALPISIFLGVIFYFLTRLVVSPMIVELSTHGIGI